MSAIKNIMTVDVEDYFQVSAFEKVINRTDWESYPCRVQENTTRIMELFDKYGVKATFFVLGWVAERYPLLIRRIVESGHELASHGYDHKRLIYMTPEEFRADIIKSTKILEDTSGTKLRGYRAPSYSVNRNNLWAHDILAECGFEYSSSVYPVKHDLYGIPDAPRFKYKSASNRLTEFPITTIRKYGKNFPCGGGGFFRLYPYQLSKWAISTVNKDDKEPVIFYFHPWEIDDEQPRVEHINLKTRFRHYLNLRHTKNKLERLLQDFSWSPMGSHLAKS